MLALALPQVDRLFPFFVCFDQSLQVLAVGRALKKLIAAADSPAPLLDLCAIERPMLKQPSFASIMQRSGSAFVLALRSHPLRLRGEVLAVDEGALFVGTPWIQELETLQATGLTLRDLALHDPTADLLVMLRSMQTSMAETAAATAKLQKEAMLREEIIRDREAKLQLIEEQRQALHALSAPIIQVWDRVLAIPLFGTIDADRATYLMEQLLGALLQQRARYAILDVTGVSTLSPDAARRLLRLLHAVALIGGQGLISGVGAALAKTLGTLAVDLSGLRSFSSLRDALAFCQSQLVPIQKP